MAAASFVPLSRCHVVLGRPDLAEEALRHVVSGEAMLEPAAIEYREAVIALADLTYGEGRFRDAIEHITEALARYPGDSEAIRLQHLLAESYLGNARLIAESIRAGNIGDEELEPLQALRDQHLHEAAALLTRLAELHALGASDPAERDRYVRATIGRADCAFDLGHFEGAIEAYEEVAAFREHPSSLVALVQIVNCCEALGDRTGAKAAHARALERIGEFPAAAFDEHPVLFDEEAWSRWLQAWPPGSTIAALPPAAAAVNAQPTEQ
jgi:tetratricopeptide (TPR) repeat protein